MSSQDKPITILCLASEYKGVPFIRECKRQGCHILLVVADEYRRHDWPWEDIDEHFYMPELSKQPDVTHAVSYLARSHQIDRIVALDDYDVATAASLREHLRLPGMGESVARHFRDKLAMRVQTQAQGVHVPPFTGLFNYDQLRAFMAQVPPPWVLKPRFEAGAVGIRKLQQEEAVWRALDDLGDQQSFYLLEQFLPGDVYHVDSIVWEGQVVFAAASRYGAPPLSVTTGGGIFNTRILDNAREETAVLRRENEALLQALQLDQGVAHTEFIRSHADRKFYFLETAARVGGANIDKMVEAATGVVLWQEAARLVLADVRGETYQLPSYRQDYAGLIICLARQEYPDLSAYQDEEIVWRLPKAYHAGLLVASASAARVEALLASYNERFAHDFLAVGQPKAEVRTNI
ncbi:MAG: ATPase [Chloroflexota bacterium]|jgi:biotin carboxylase